MSLCAARHPVMTQPRHHHVPPTPFGLDEDRLEDGATPVIAVRGELDLFTAPELRDRLREADGETDLVVDLSACSFVDASGCQVLLRAARQLAATGRRLAIVNPNPENARIFAVMGLDELFPVVASRPEAAQALRHGAA